MRRRSADGKLDKGGRPRKTGLAGNPVSLAAAGIDKNLAHLARVAAMLSSAQFEESVKRAVRIAVASAESAGLVLKEARVEVVKAKQARRAEREHELAKKITAMPTRQYGVILADPPWTFRVRSEAGMDRAPPYPVMTLDELQALELPAADNCVLFCWSTVPHLLQALQLIARWGFVYRSALFWDKGIDGTGYWARNRIEILIIAVAAISRHRHPASNCRSSLQHRVVAIARSRKFSPRISRSFFQTSQSSSFSRALRDRAGMFSAMKRPKEVAKFKSRRESGNLPSANVAIAMRVQDAGATVEMPYWGP
jgi:N6-adenosine-specific RNA methylase IME4